jgi:hypothetical protein
MITQCLQFERAVDYCNIRINQFNETESLYRTVLTLSSVWYALGIAGNPFNFAIRLLAMVAGRRLRGT